MILLDNYMLLTRDEEQGRLVVVSRVRTKSVSGLMSANTSRLSYNCHGRGPARETARQYRIKVEVQWALVWFASDQRSNFADRQQEPR
jgi:hypothetical protein